MKFVALVLSLRASAKRSATARSEGVKLFEEEEVLQLYFLTVGNASMR